MQYIEIEFVIIPFSILHQQTSSQEIYKKCLIIKYWRLNHQNGSILCGLGNYPISVLWCVTLAIQNVVKWCNWIMRERNFHVVIIISSSHILYFYKWIIKFLVLALCQKLLPEALQAHTILKRWHCDFKLYPVCLVHVQCCSYKHSILDDLGLLLFVSKYWSSM